MHGAVLQNDDYMKFADEMTVEVLSLSRLDEAVQKQDPKAATYDAVDAEGNPVKYMVSWPGLTFDEIVALNRSKAGTYNQTGRIPYTAIVDPYTGEQLQSFSGGQSAKTLMEAVATHAEKLVAEHGPRLSRKDVREVDALKAECNEMLADKGAGKALAQLKKDAKKLEKKGERVAKLVEDYLAELMGKAGEELDKADGLIDSGDVSEAKKILSSLKSALRKTDLEERVDALYEKIKASGG